MKVKELIEQLRTLDQEREIWVPTNQKSMDNIDEFLKQGRERMQEYIDELRKANPTEPVIIEGIEGRPFTPEDFQHLDELNEEMLKQNPPKPYQWERECYPLENGRNYTSSGQTSSTPPAWVLYDMNYPQEPNFEEATEDVEGDNERSIKVGDYVHDSW